MDTVRDWLTYIEKQGPAWVGTPNKPVGPCCSLLHSHVSLPSLPFNLFAYYPLASISFSPKTQAWAFPSFSFPFFLQGMLLSYTFILHQYQCLPDSLWAHMAHSFSTSVLQHPTNKTAKRNFMALAPEFSLIGFPFFSYACPFLTLSKFPSQTKPLSTQMEINLKNAPLIHFPVWHPFPFVWYWTVHMSKITYLFLHTESNPNALQSSELTSLVPLMHKTNPYCIQEKAGGILHPSTLSCWQV